jgi:hypothetical protein
LGVRIFKAEEFRTGNNGLAKGDQYDEHEVPDKDPDKNPDKNIDPCNPPRGAGRDAGGGTVLERH